MTEEQDAKERENTKRKRTDPRLCVVFRTRSLSLSVLSRYGKKEPVEEGSEVPAADVLKRLMAKMQVRRALLLSPPSFCFLREKLLFQGMN